MMEEILSLFACMVVLDYIELHCARHRLFDFLIGQTGKSNKAKKIRDEQALFDSVSMSYIAKYLTRYQTEFKRYHTRYKVMLYMLLPQYLSVGILSIFFYDEKVFMLLFCSFVLIKVIAVLLIFGPPRGHSVYVQKKSGNKRRKRS